MNITIKGIPLEVDFDYFPATIGQRDSMGVPITPDNPADCEIQSVKVEGTEILPLLGMKEIGEIEEAILAQLEDEECSLGYDDDPREWREAI